MSIEKVKQAIRTVPDFPKKGIMFKDITTVLKDKELFKLLIDLLVKEAKKLEEFDVIVGIESRGFILASAMAYVMNKGFVPVRKKGKLPAKKVEEEYELEYGTDSIEVHVDGVEGKKVLIVDDVLATGGTAKAAGNLIKKAGGEVAGFLFLMELAFLKGKEKLEEKVISLIVEN